MAKVVWERMIVRGFGPYAEEASVELSPAANVLVAPNEAGKSTLGAALAAILYGLPATADPERFGQGRYRHWGQASRFEGELYLTVDGTEYHLTRQFETHKVSLRRKEDGRWRLLVDGVADNPESRRPNPQYRRFLRETIGLESRELFEVAFCLAQPLPSEVELDSAVQQLLTGTENRYDQVRKGLENQIKALTRFYGAALGDKSKGTKARRLEEIASRIADLEQQIATGRDAADGLQTVQRQLQEVAQQLTTLQERLARREALEKAWLQWRTERERHQSALRAYHELEQSLTAAQALASRLSEIAVQINGDYGEFRMYGDELTPRLEEMERIRQLREQVQAEIESIESGLHAKVDALAALEREQQELPEALRSPSIAADHAHLQELSTAMRRWQADCGAWRAALEQVQSELESLPDFARLTEHPVVILEDLTGWLDECVHVIDRWTECRRQVVELESTMAQEYSLLMDADPSLLALASSYTLKKMELTQAEQAAGQAYHELRQSADAYHSAEQAFARRFGIQAVDVSVMLPAVRERIRTLNTTTHGEAKPRGRHASPAAALAGVWLLSAALGGLTGWWVGGTLGWVAAAVVALALGGTLHWLLSRPRAGVSSDESRSGPARVDETLGQLSHCGLEELTEARSMLEQLAHLGERRPRADQLAASQQAWEKAQAALSAWKASVRSLSEAFADPQAAYGEWQALEQRRALLRQEMRLLSQQLGCGDLGAGSAVLTLLERRHLREALGLLGADPTSLEELAEFVRSSGEQWQQLSAQARRWDELQRQRSQLQADLAAASQRGADGLTMGERFAQEAAMLRQRLAPFMEEIPTELLHREMERYRDLTQEIGEYKALVQEKTKLLDGKLRQARELDDQWQAALGPILPLWDSCGASLPELRSRYRGYVVLRQEEAQVRQALQGALASRGLESLADLERMKTDQALNLVAIKSRWQALIDEHPGLPSFDEAIQGQVVEDQYRALQDELRSLREKIQELHRAEDDLRGRQAALQGQMPINIAAASDELLRLRQQQRQGEKEIQALGLAYRELAAAITEYEGSYRERLVERATAYFRQITGDTTRSVELDADFSVGVSTADGRTIVPRQLSQGARDQLYISLRLAIADLMADSLTLPMIFDDPFVNCDEERLERSRAAIQAISGGRQTLLLTHQSQMRSWGQEVEVAARP